MGGRKNPGDESWRGPNQRKYPEEKYVCITCGHRNLTDEDVKGREERCYNCRVEDDAMVVLGEEEGWA